MEYSRSSLDVPNEFNIGQAVCAEISGGISLSDLPPDVISSMILELGAADVILFRNTGIDNAAGFARVCANVHPGLAIHETGEHPATEGGNGVYEPVNFSQSDRLLWHHENSFNWQWPLIVAFACVSPADTGGETTLVDSSLVYASASPNFKKELEKKGIRYRRFCDGRAGRSWQSLYGTEDWSLAKLRARERQERLMVEEEGVWIEATRPAFFGEETARVWFNQLLHWHPQALPKEIRIMTEQGILPRYRDCTFGDGTTIAPAYVDEIVRLHEQFEWSIRWRAGDLLFFPNEHFSHGRAPYSGKRRHFAQFLGHGGYNDPRTPGVASTSKAR